MTCPSVSMTTDSCYNVELAAEGACALTVTVCQQGPPGPPGPPGPDSIPEPGDDGIPKMRQTAAGVSSWVDSGDAAVKNVGTGSGDVAAGNAPTIAIAEHMLGADQHPISGVQGLQTVLDAKVGSSDASTADIVTLTQAEYDALSPPDDTTLYLICG